MDEASQTKWHRESELEALSSNELGRMIRAGGYRMDGRRNKTNRKFAVLHLEGFKVAQEIVNKLKLVKLEPI